MKYAFVMLLTLITMNAHSQTKVQILSVGEECGRAPIGASKVDELVPHTQCADGLFCWQKIRTDHDGWDAFGCQKKIILSKGEECGRAPSGASKVDELVPNTQCAEGLVCGEKIRIDHDGWTAFGCR